MRCVGLLGEVVGYSDGFTWDYPAIQLESALVGPNHSRWTTAELVTLAGGRRDAMLPIDPALEVNEGDLILVRGAVYREHQTRASVTSSINWSSSYNDSDLAIATIDIFVAEEQRIRDLASASYWSALVSEDLDRCRSSLRLLQVNGQLDRVTPLVLRAIMHARFPDPVAMDRLVQIARSRAGLDSSDLIDAARSLLDSLHQASPSTELGQLQEDLVHTLGRLSPIIYLPDVLQQRQVSELVEVVLHQVEKGVKQGRPVEIRARQVRKGQQVAPLALALVAHLLGHDTEGRLTLDTAESPARNVLERTGVLDLAGHGVLRAQREFAVGHVELRSSTTAFHVTDFHRSPERTYRQQLIENDIPRWLRNACSATSERHRDSISRTVGRLLDNVRAHADLTRGELSRSGLYLSVTYGGGEESTNRLSVVVFDNGVGLRTALEKECGRLDSKTPELVGWLFGDEIAADRDGSGLEPIGSGFRELVAALRRITEHARSYGDVPARPHLNVMSSSRVDGGTEVIVADVLSDPPWIGGFPSPSEATGTTILLSIPLARTDLDLEPTSFDADDRDSDRDRDQEAPTETPADGLAR
jgi:hypothetical protein